MELGAFSVSLAVKDLAKSREFYESLGFESFGGDGENYLMMRNCDSVIGLFQGMFEQNILTFNPGWDANAAELQEFIDVRELLESVRAKGIEPVHVAVDGADGPANFVLVDPDGNTILLDQHV